MVALLRTTDDRPLALMQRPSPSNERWEHPGATRVIALEGSNFTEPASWTAPEDTRLSAFACTSSVRLLRVNQSQRAALALRTAVVLSALTEWPNRVGNKRGGISACLRDRGGVMHVVITGASSGIGEALAREYLARGASVTLVARRAALLQNIAQSAPGRVHVVVSDLTDTERACDFLDGAERALGPIDVLINNAGASMVHRTVDTVWEQADALFRLNVLTPFKLTIAVAPRLLSRGQGCIVDVASVSALAPTPGFFFYSASKAALAAGSESLREELRRGGVHVLTVYPGPVHTPMADANFAALDPTLAKRMPTGDTRTLARLIADAVVKRKPRVIYPRVYTFTRYLPALARWLVDRSSPEIKTPRVQLAFVQAEDTAPPAAS